MASEETNEDKQVRKCGFCGEIGHNQRSCEKRKASEGSSTAAKPVGGKPKKTAAAKKGKSGSTSTPSAIVRPASNGAATSTGDLDVPTSANDFQEVREQRVIEGSTISAAIRKYANGVLQIGVRFQRGEKVTEMPIVNLNEATALYVMLGGILQHSKRTQETPNPFVRATHVNGTSPKSGHAQITPTSSTPS